jgi:hypothetical protein
MRLFGRTRRSIFFPEHAVGFVIGREARDDALEMLSRLANGLRRSGETRVSTENNPHAIQPWDPRHGDSPYTYLTTLKGMPAQLLVALQDFGRRIALAQRLE